MDLYTLQEKMNELADEFLADMTEVSASALGIDPRASHRFYVSQEGIAVEKDREGSVDYYAGFEYASEYKTVIGEYVFWSAESNRICKHLQRLPDFEDLKKLEFDDEEE